jgi:UTP--glucose-1-phosphate uridylyltransferase
MTRRERIIRAPAVLPAPAELEGARPPPRTTHEAPCMFDALPEDTRALLSRFHFDRVPFESLRQTLARHPDPEALHRIVGPVTAAPSDSVAPGIPSEPARRAQLEADGAAAIARGELAVVVLAGGMATRFGGVVKALAPLADDTRVRFLDAKTADFARHPAVDVTYMTSFATHDALGRALRAEGIEHNLVPQFVSLRLQRNGELFLDDRGLPSPYATGHGDLPDAMRCAGAIDRWKSRGVRSVLVMNVDNLGATIDPVLFGQHRALGGSITAELVAKRPGDRGGVAALHDGAVKLCEAFRLPPDFAHDAIPTFNTNTLWIDLDVLEVTERPWTWCVARKTVHQREAIQFERLVGELTWWNPSRYVLVPRDGAESRFLPVKDVAELGRSREAIAAVLGDRLGLSLDDAAKTSP